MSYLVYSETKDILDLDKQFKPECKDLIDDEQFIKTCVKLMMNCIHETQYSKDGRIDVARA
tara:strand:- start:2482 stop:2664 length:183 start_codon:yes stop_codon:yes gene_type:complete